MIRDESTVRRGVPGRRYVLETRKSIPQRAHKVVPVELLIMLQVQVLTEDEWLKLRDVRLTALRECPEAFLSSYERELTYGEGKWRAEFSRGEWTVVVKEGRTVGLIGVTREDDTPSNECYIEYLWVSPEYHSGSTAR